MTTFLAYVDDSGDKTGSLHTALLIPAEQWSRSLDTWKKYRRALNRAHHVPPEHELHAYLWIKAKKSAATKPDAEIDRIKGLRQQWMKKALQTIGTMQIQTFTHLAPTAIKRDAYREFLGALDRALAMTDHHAMLIIDGKPGQDDHAARDDHRDLHLRSRRILEDGWIQDASRSQFIQMTDFVAYSAFKHREQHPDKRFMWNWYPDHMHELELGGSCICRP